MELLTCRFHGNVSLCRNQGQSFCLLFLLALGDFLGDFSAFLAGNYLAHKVTNQFKDESVVLRTTLSNPLHLHIGEKKKKKCDEPSADGANKFVIFFPKKFV